MAAETFTITVTEEQKATLTAKAEAAGIDPAGGVLPTEHGVSLSFAVDGDLVEFTVLAKPFYVSLDMIESGIEELVGGAG